MSRMSKLLPTRPSGNRSPTTGSIAPMIRGMSREEESVRGCPRPRCRFGDALPGRLKPRFEPIPGWSRPFLSVSDISQKSRNWSSTPSTPLTSRGLARHPSRSDLIARLGRLNLELDAGEIEEWALEISEGQRIQIRTQGGSRRQAAERLPVGALSYAG
jgi:hypothetical protein